MTLRGLVDATDPKAQGCYMLVNDLNIYYEDHGADGVPFVLLHGGLTTIDTSFADILPSFAKTRRVIAMEQQGHGHTADIDRPLTFEGMGADTASLIRRLGIERADFLGYSDGGNVAVALAISDPTVGTEARPCRSEL